jgi:hypothetical protein
MVKYHTSKKNPNCFFASLEGVVVAMWHESDDPKQLTGWMDRCIYRPLREHYTKIEWSGPAYDPALLVDTEEFEIVKSTGEESPRIPCVKDF